METQRYRIKRGAVRAPKAPQLQSRHGYGFVHIAYVHPCVFMCVYVSVIATIWVKVAFGRAAAMMESLEQLAARTEKASAKAQTAILDVDAWDSLTKRKRTRAPNASAPKTPPNTSGVFSQVDMEQLPPWKRRIEGYPCLEQPEWTDEADPQTETEEESSGKCNSTDAEKQNGSVRGHPET